MTTPAENKELVRERFEAMNEQDFNAVRELYADGYTTTLTHPDGREEEVDLDELTERWQENFDAVPDGEFHLKEMAAEDDWVLVRYRATGTHEGEYLGIEGTGNELDVQGYGSYRFENGKIVETHGQLSLTHALSQMGVDLPIETA